MTPPAAAPAYSPRPGVAPRRAPARPRRVSGPARPGRPAHPTRPGAGARRTGRQPLIRALPAAVGRVAEHPLVGRLIASKAWIGVIAFALIGIVALQLFLLQLNRSIGRDLARETVLQQQNAALSVENSELAIGERIQRQATGLGMTLIPSSSLRFLGAHSGAASKAAAALSAPVSQSTPEIETKPTAGHAEASSEGTTAGGSASSHEASSEGTAEGASGAAASSPEAGTGEHTERTEHTEAGSETHSAPASEASGTEASSGGGTSAAPTG